MIDNDFNTFNTEIQKQNERKVETKDKRKTLVVFMMILIGQTMCVLNTLINNFTIQTFKIQYPLLFYGGFYFFFFLIWMCINRKITEPKRYYYLIIILETQSFFFDYLANYSYTSQIDSIKKNNDNNLLLNNDNILDESNKDNNSKDDIDIQFINSYPTYIYFPIQFILTFLIFIFFMRKKYYLQILSSEKTLFFFIFRNYKCSSFHIFLYHKLFQRFTQLILQF